MAAVTDKRGPMRKIPRNIFYLGWVSFLTDFSSEMVLPVILPLFMKSVLPPAIAMPAIGLIEGLAQSAASLLKLVSGWLSDRIGRRKLLVVIGYAVSMVVKPLFALAGVWWHFLVLRFGERTGKGIRTAPRDALIAGSADGDRQGVSFGFHRALDTAGALLGLLSALILVWVFRLEGEQVRPIFVISFFPALAGVIVLVLTVREKAPATETGRKQEVKPKVTLSRQFGWYLFIVGLFTLGNSSDAFLTLRADEAGFSAAAIIMLMLLMNAGDAALATWFGGLSDRIGRRKVLVISFAIYAVVYFGLGAATQKWMLWPLMALYGLYYAACRGALRAMVADLVPREDARGTAYGALHAVIGVVALPSSFIMGVLWKTLGFRYAFYLGGGLALVAAILLLLLIHPEHVED